MSFPFAAQADRRRYPISSDTLRLVPIEPPPSTWVFPPAASADEHGLVGIGADLEPGTLLLAYRSGLFPMPFRKRGPIGWWSPDPRGILELDRLRLTRSLRQSIGKFDVRFDRNFAAVMRACADPRRPNGWIEKRMFAAYVRLHELGWAHSVETYDQSGNLVGGLYGVAIGGLFAGESMFHHTRDASKVALAALVDFLRGGGCDLLDVQWLTPHLASLGATEITRPSYVERVRHAVGLPLPHAWR
jgi:leucyl/phenylalanyl-tRNA--protein transferase